MRRVVEPELLDDLAPADALAAGSRGDLRRLNGIMGNADILFRATRSILGVAAGGSRRLRVVELGSGDGTLALQWVRRAVALGVGGDLTLVDRQSLVSSETRRAFEELHWSVENVGADAFDWFERSTPNVDLMLANLFLHHFVEPKLRVMFQRASLRTGMFVACEPRRSRVALTAARWVGLLGCNAVTRHDAVLSVRAGFAGSELGALWPAADGWRLSEYPARLFSHCFAATRSAPEGFR